MRTIFAQIISLLLPILVPVIAAYLAVLAQRYVKNDAVLKALQTVGVVTKIAVANAAQQTVNDLKDPMKPGTWDTVAAASVKASVVADVKLLGKQPLALLEEHGMDTSTLVDRGIESEVHSLAKVTS